MLVDDTGANPSHADLCDTATVVSYAVVECRTKAGAIPTDIQVGVKNMIGGTVYSYDGPDSSAVMYRTFDATTWPKITAPTSLGPFTTVIGCRFKQQGMAAFPYCDGYYAGVKATSCVNLGFADEYALTWTIGLPR